MTREAKIGLIGITSFIIFIYAYYQFKQQHYFSTNMTLTAKFDAVDFAKKGKKVYVHGRQVGVVSAVYKKPNDDDVYIDLNIENIEILPRNTVASIYSESVMGGVALQLIYDKACTSGCLQDGDQIEGTLDGFQQNIERTALPILEEFGKVADLINSDSTGLDTVLASAYASIHQLRLNTNKWKKSAASAAKTVPSTTASIRKMTSQDWSLNIGVDAKQQNAIDSLLTTISTLTQEDIDAMTKILYTAAEELPKVGPQVEKVKNILPKINNKIDSVGLALQKYEAGNDNMIARLLHDQSIKDSTKVKIQGVSTKLGDIRKNPEKYLSLKN